MRNLIVMATLAGALGLGTIEADVPKRIDVARQIELLKSGKTAGARAEAAAELGRHGAVRARDVKDALDPLREALKNDTSPDVRRAAAKALGDINPDAAATVPALTEALKDKSPVVKMAAARALGQYGAEARSAVPALQALAKEKSDKKVMQAARLALKSIRGKKK
jgi:HEAT repeat protein